MIFAFSTRPFLFFLSLSLSQRLRFVGGSHRKRSGEKKAKIAAGIAKRSYKELCAFVFMLHTPNCWYSMPPYLAQKGK